MNSLENLVDDFALFDNWEDRYRYLIDLGKNLPPMDESLKTDKNIVQGCTSKVWIYPQISKNAADKDVLTFTADSDAQIVRGLIHILMMAYQNKTPAEISAVNIEDYFKALGLSEHLSPNRRNGFFSMVSYIKSYSL